jgi:hypothetical protein
LAIHGAVAARQIAGRLARRLTAFADVAIHILPILVSGLILAAWTGLLDRSAALPAGAIQPFQGHGYYIGPISAVLPNPCGTALLCPVQGDADDTPAVSRLILLEDGKPLGPAHSVHQAVNEAGLGRYSHWDNVLLFSSSDNSDPRTNRRVYTIIARPAVARMSLLGILLFGVLVAARPLRGLADPPPMVQMAIAALRSLAKPSWLVLRMAAPIAAGTGVLGAAAFVLASSDADRGFFAPGASIDYLIVKVQRDRAARSPAVDVAFFGDSSCLMGIDVPRLRAALHRPLIESFCTLGFVGPAGYAVQIERLLDRGAAPRNLVLVFHPIQFQRHASWEGWSNLVADGLPPPAVSVGGVFDYMRRKWFDGAFYMPLPGAYAKYYGGSWQFEASVAHGSAVDPGNGLDIHSLSEFLRRIAARQTYGASPPAIATLNDRFREALVPLARTVARFGVERTFLVITPMPDVSYHGETVLDLAASTRQLAAALGIPAHNVIATDPALPPPYFSSATHLNRWGRELYTDAFAARAGKDF